MGHVRLGQLPKTRKWTQVLELLETSPMSIEEVAYRTALAANRQLENFEGDRGISYCFWLLTRLTWAARSYDFVGVLNSLGVDAASDTSALSFISSLSDRARSGAAKRSGSGLAAEMSTLALQKSLSETIVLKAATLFGTTTEDVRIAFSGYSSKKKFSELTRLFFSALFTRTLQYFLNLELPNHIGTDKALKGLEDASRFNRAVATYTWEVAKIIEDFAGGWYSLHNWQSKGEISEKEASGFTAIALQKMRMELTREGTGK